MSYPSSDAYSFEDFDTAADHLLLSSTPSPYSEIELEFGMTTSTEQNPVQYSIGAPVDIPYQMQLFLEQDNVDFDHDPFIAQFTSSNEQVRIEIPASLYMKSPLEMHLCENPHSALLLIFGIFSNARISNALLLTSALLYL